MTYAPAKLKEAREYLLSELDMHPGRDVDADLDPDEVGIISTGYGDSYHRGKGYIGDGSYSAYFERDRRGLSDAASALDIGEFDVTRDGHRLTLFRFNAWLVAQCEANTPDTRDIRSVIYTLDGKTVKRWDRHKRRDSGDSSHLWHTHISYYRDSEYRDKTALFRRYVEGDDDMVDLNPAQNLAVTDFAKKRFADQPTVTDGIHVSTGITGSYAYGRALYEDLSRVVIPMLHSLVASHTGSSLDEVRAMVRAELDRAAENERTERAAEYAALSDTVAARVAERFGSDVGQVVADELLAALHRGTEPAA